MLKFNLKYRLLHNDGLTFAVARALFQRVQHFHQVSYCPEFVTIQRGVHCCKDKHVLQKQCPNNRKWSLYIHTRGFYCGKISCEEANKKRVNVAAFLENGEQPESESSEDLDIELIERSTAEILNRKPKHRSRIDVSTYMDNIDEMADLDRTSPEVYVPEQVVPMYYKPKSIIATVLEEEEAMIREHGIEDIGQSDISEVSEVDQFRLAERGELVVEGVNKVPMPHDISLDMIVNDSKVLQDLVQLGVDLIKLQQKGMIETVMKLHAKKEMAPYIFFLRDNGVPEDQVGRLITRCPWIFQHRLHNLRVRIDYLLSKNFKIKHLSNMLDRDPKFLLIPVQKIDARLGYIQKQFNLTGEQIRTKVGGYSKLITAPSLLLKQNMLILENSLGFSPEESKTMFLAFPKIFHREADKVARSFEYVHNVMEISHDLIAKTPHVLNTPRERIDSRHRFLIKCGRAQYDPTKENYVSLMSLVSKTDEDWCFEVAKSSVAEYNRFLKMI